MILTTHSTYIVSDSDLLDIVRVDRDDLGNTRCLRLPDDYQGLEQSERILSAENAEAIFADRVVLVEGPSEAQLLPLISRLTKQADSEGTCDFDRLNISTLNVGGKGEFSKYTSLFDTQNLMASHR